MSIADLPKEGNVCVVGRILGIRPDVIHRRDGTGSIDVVRGRLADDTGSIGFLSWEPLELDVGQLVKIDGANVRTFRDTPELNFGRTTTIEAYHDAAFASTEDLKPRPRPPLPTFGTGLATFDAWWKSTNGSADLHP